MSEKRKFILLASGFILMIWLAWSFSFSRTLDLWNNCQRLEKEQLKIREIPEKLPALTAKVERLKIILGSTGGFDFSNLILEKINSLCEIYHIRLKEIPEKHIYNGQNLKVETLDISLQGPFANQLSVISALEKDNTMARLRSLKFQLITDQTNGERYLQSSIYLQSIKLEEQSKNLSDEN